jgi:rubrerythrin
MDEKKLLKEALHELHGAKHYAKCAIKYRDADPPRAKKYYDMAADELRHADNLYQMAKAVGDPQHTALEKEFLDGLCDEYTEKLGRAKALLDAYRGA